MSITRLHTFVRMAVSIELTTLPTYLYPYWSIRPSYDGGSDKAQAARTSMMSVILEEMLHMGLSSNLLNALDGTPNFIERPYLPVFPEDILRSDETGHVGGVHVDLHPLGPAALDLMVRIELPDSDDPSQGTTIGAFYEELLALLDSECTNADFVAADGKPRRQLAPWDNPGAGQLYPVTSLETAHTAVMEILHQGEGLSSTVHTDGDHELAHYWRFKQIQDWWNAGELSESDVYPVVDSPTSNLGSYSDQQLEVNHAFNDTYSRMLDALQATLMSDEPDVYPVASGRMGQLGQLAAQLRATGPMGGVDGAPLPGPTFEYVSSEG